ncbi:LysE family translocator [Streptomyces sp. MI02-7b]|uniref:LysE family translocator n=1 Tax=Streptomyces sp. MI02-7b TaxID=462941 RepID=UPI0029A97CCF|nr:LysE family translocator [Streptomyces sp. MI02-7b]MDX3073898.1 LysE family translocator [Streptomyces sp. MI02-7b]
MDAHLIAFCGVAAGMVVMPGADFAVVVRNALGSRRTGVATGVGIAGGLLVHTALAVAGLAAVLVAVPALFRTVQLLGGAYLLFLGSRAVVAAVRRGRSGAADGAAGGDQDPGRGVVRGLRQGFLTNALNPKAPVLFLSLLPQFVPAGQPAVPRTLLLSAIVVAMALVWFPGVALLVDGLGTWLRRPAAASWVRGVSGGMLVALGAVLLTGVRP